MASPRSDTDRPALPSRGARLMAAAGLGLIASNSITNDTLEGFAVAGLIAVPLFVASEIVVRLRKGEVAPTLSTITFRGVIIGSGVAAAGFLAGILLHS